MAGGLILLVIVVLVALGLYGVVRVAETLRRARTELIRESAVFNGRMVAQDRPHRWIVPPPSRVERVMYAVADVVSVRWRRRNRRAAAVRAVMEGGR